MDQAVFTGLSFDGKKKSIRWEMYVAEMECELYGAQLFAANGPTFRKAGSGRRPMPLAETLRACLMQWCATTHIEFESACSVWRRILNKIYRVGILSHFKSNLLRLPRRTPGLPEQSC